MLTRIDENASQMRAVVDGSQWDSLLEKADALYNEQRWTIGDIERLYKDGDKRAEVLVGPLGRMLLQGMAMFREANAATFPRLVWSSMVVTVLSEWEVVLRSYPQYLAYHLRMTGLQDPDAIGERLMDGFKSFVNGPLALGLDFSCAPGWESMNGHRLVRNLIVHWGGYIDGPSSTKAERFIERRGEEIGRRGNLLVLSRRYVDSLVIDAKNFLFAFDEALLDRFLQLMKCDT